MWQAHLVVGHEEADGRVGREQGEGEDEERQLGGDEPHALQASLACTREADGAGEGDVGAATT